MRNCITLSACLLHQQRSQALIMLQIWSCLPTAEPRLPHAALQFLWPPQPQSQLPANRRHYQQTLLMSSAKNTEHLLQSGYTKVWVLLLCTVSINHHPGKDSVTKNLGQTTEQPGLGCMIRCYFPITIAADGDFQPSKMSLPESMKKDQMGF